MTIKLPFRLLLLFLVISFLTVLPKSIFALNCPRGEQGNLDCGGDSIIDETDLNIILRCWRGQPDAPECDLLPGERDANIDGDADGLVDGSDMRILLANWNTVGGSTVDFYGNQVHLVKVFGAKSFGEVTQDTVAANKINHAPGVLVDTSSKPNKIYVADSGNSRILGFSSLGTCSNQSAQQCTNDTDCVSPGVCEIDIHKSADLIFGQPDGQTAACNGDSNIGMNGETSASKLCLMDFPEITNTGEHWNRINFDTDSSGNLYFPDVYNNRVLIYFQPFSSDKSGGKGDAIADFVIGQESFTTNSINHGLGKNSRDNHSLYLTFGGFDNVAARGASVDADGNVWVADTFNYRVLRFPAGSKIADLVIGQANFSSADTSGCLGGRNGPASTPLSKICTPTLARLDPDSGNLYVIDEHPDGFPARILVYEAPFTNGEPASRAIYPNQDGSFTNWGWDYFFETTGFVFNKYKVGEYANGKLWVNEHISNRTLLLDDSGNILKVIGVPDKYYHGCDYGYYGRCKGNDAIFRNFNLCWPGGNIGFDDANNIYLADEEFSRVSRFSLPYNTSQVGQNICVPDADGGLFDGTNTNSISGYNFRGGVGTFVFNDQLVVKDQYRFLVWNNYLAKENGSKADFVIGQTSDSVRTGNYLGMRAMHAIDDQNRLWTVNSQGKLIVYQLPLQPGSEPLANYIKLYWADNPNGEINYQSSEKGIGFDPVGKALWVIDNNNRLFRISNYSNLSRLYVDAVIGQPDKNHLGCNYDYPNGWIATGPPTASSLCGPYTIEFDKFGNLYVVESSYECHGNNRITVFMAGDLAQINTMFPNTAAKKVFISSSLTQMPNCGVRSNGPRAPVSIAFDSQNHMIVGNDGYSPPGDPRHLKQLWYYDNPLMKDAGNNYIQGQLPDAYINLPMGAPGEINFDSEDNLVVQDHTWAKVWVINLAQDPSWLIPVNH